MLVSAESVAKRDKRKTKKKRKYRKISTSYMPIVS